MELSREICRQLRYARINAGLTVEELALRAKTSSRHVRRIERGAFPGQPQVMPGDALVVMRRAMRK